MSALAAPVGSLQDSPMGPIRGAIEWEHWPRYVDTSKPERVYWNLHRKCWSIQGYVRGKGYRVLWHYPRLKAFDVTFKVSEAGRYRVIREGRKNVHAYAVVHGAIYPHVRQPTATWDELVTVSYNPYEMAEFVSPSGRPLRGVRACHFGADGRLTSDLRHLQYKGGHS